MRSCVPLNTRRRPTSDSTTLTVRLSAETKYRLALLAGRTRQTRSFLAAEAIAACVERELAIIEGIERGRADVRAGRVVPHDEVARDARDHREGAGRAVKRRVVWTQTARAEYLEAL